MLLSPVIDCVTFGLDVRMHAKCHYASATLDARNLIANAFTQTSPILGMKQYAATEEKKNMYANFHVEQFQRDGIICN